MSGDPSCSFFFVYTNYLYDKQGNIHVAYVFLRYAYQMKMRMDRSEPNYLWHSEYIYVLVGHKHTTYNNWVEHKINCNFHSTENKKDFRDQRKN